MATMTVPPGVTTATQNADDGSRAASTPAGGGTVFSRAHGGGGRSRREHAPSPAQHGNAASGPGLPNVGYFQAPPPPAAAPTDPATLTTGNGPCVQGGKGVTALVPAVPLLPGQPGENETPLQEATREAGENALLRARTLGMGQGGAGSH